MTTEMKSENKAGRTTARAYANASSSAGIFWVIGWLFTIAYAHLVWWQMIVGVVIWPYYLGLAVR